MSRNLKTIIRNALTANVIVREGEKKRSVSKLEGIVLRQLKARSRAMTRQHSRR